MPTDVVASGPKNFIQKGDILDFINKNNIKVGEGYKSADTPVVSKELKKKPAAPTKKA